MVYRVFRLPLIFRKVVKSRYLNSDSNLTFLDSRSTNLLELINRESQSLRLDVLSFNPDLSNGFREDRGVDKLRLSRCIETP